MAAIHKVLAWNAALLPTCSVRNVPAMSRNGLFQPDANREMQQPTSDYWLHRQP